MAINMQATTPTPSQFASARTHLERRDEWRTVRIDDVRYITVVSGRSNRLYLVRADGNGCGCTWSLTMSSPCSHRVAVDLAALEDELEQGYVIGSASLKAMRAEYRGCAAGCGNVVEQSNLLFCDQCSAARERAAERQERNRALCERLGI